jgi:hypothetical protein
VSDTVIVRGSGGALFERTVPTGGQALDIWNEQLAKGDLVVVTEPTEWVEAADGTRNLRIVPVEEAPQRAKPGRKPKAETPTDEPTEAPAPDEE